MADDLDQIETSYLDKLVEIKGGQERFRGLIEKAEAGREKVSAEVFGRVLKDYETRIAGLEEEARPLREQARTEFGKLREIHARLSKELDAARLDAEELHFRHELGELPEEDFKERQKNAKQAVGRAEKAFAAADALRQRFLEVIPEPPPSQEPPPPASPPPPPSPEAAADDDMVETVYDMSAPPIDPADSASTQSTEAVAPVRLVEKRADDAEPAVYALAGTVTVGRVPGNDIVLDSREVSRHHAKIVVTGSRVVITDLGSGNGTWVNEDRVQEGPVADGDVVRFGGLPFVVRIEPPSE